MLAFLGFSASVTVANTQAPSPNRSVADTGPTSAGLPVQRLAPVTVTASRRPLSLVETPASVTLVTREDMDRKLTTSIEDLTRQLPGIAVNRQTSGTDPFGSLGGFTVRGVSGNRVQVIIDGARTLERITDQTRDVVELSNLKAVEIVRGPASVLWGSDAIGGVVSFTTKDPEDYLADGRAVAGQVETSFADVDDNWTKSALVAGAQGPFGFLLNYTRRDAEEPEKSKSRAVGGIWSCPRNPEAIRCNELNPADIAADNLLGKLVWSPSAAHRLKLTGEYFMRVTDVDQRFDLGPQAGGIINTSYLRTQALERWRLTGDWVWSPNVPWLREAKLQVTYQPQRLERFGDRRRTLANRQLESRYDELGYREEFFEAELQAISAFGTGALDHTLTYGIDGGLTKTTYSRLDVVTNLTTGTVSPTRAGGFNFSNAETQRLDGFVQDEIALFDRRVLLTPGLRYATYRIEPTPDVDFRRVPGREPRTLDEKDLSAKFGAVFKVFGGWSVYGQYAEGFKMPTAEQLFTSVPASTPTGFNLVPNPNLRPERVRALEGGVRFENAEILASLAVFDAKYEDFIQSFFFIPSTNDITFENLTAVDVRGVEGSLLWQFLPRWSVSASASWQRGKQQAQRGAAFTPFDGARPLQATLALRYRDEAWDLELSASGQDDIERVSAPTRFKPRGYVFFDFLASYRLNESVTLRFAAFNLFDRRYLPLPPGGTVYDTDAATSAAVKVTNPIELQIAPGRNFRAGVSLAF